MAVETTSTGLVTEYETIRRKQYTLITDLISLLPRINNLEEQYVAQARDALFHADHPFLMVFVGPFSSGKSSIINALLGREDLLVVGPIPTTDRISILRYGEDAQKMDSGGEVDTVFYPNPLLKKVSFVDTPGLESVFQKHEDITRKFMHRADVVLLVMLATQAMTSRNLEYIQKLREYGKKVIIIINQVDLLSPEEAETVRNYVLDQSLERLGYKPQVFMVSAKQGKASYKDTIRDEALWKTSGMNQFEEYVEKQLGDVERVRQKLQTPLQIVQNVNTAALRIVRSNQGILDQYQTIMDNVNQQLTAHQREQEKTVRELTQEVGEKFGSATARGAEAIRDIFQFSRALSSMIAGILELTGLAAIFRRGNQPPYVKQAFDRRKVFEPIDQLPDTVDKLGPRLEGRDLQDIDDLVKYAQKEIKALPPTIREKIIGSVTAPLQYDRRAIQEIRPELESMEREAKVVETDNLTSSVRSALLYLGLWELLVLLVGVVVLITGLGGTKPENIAAVVFGIIAFVLLGLLMLPLTGRMMQNRYTSRLLKLQSRYIELLTKTADKQVDYGMRLRRDSIAPLTRLIEAQSEIQTDQLNRLQFTEQEMARIEIELNKLGKRNFLGVR